MSDLSTTGKWRDRLRELHRGWERHAAGIPPEPSAGRPPTWRTVSEIPPDFADIIVLDGQAPDLSGLVDNPRVEALGLTHEADDGVLQLISKLTSLRSLSLYVARGADPAPLRRLTGLEHLSLGGSDIRTLDVLKYFRNLATLALSDLRKVHSIEPLSSLHGLRWLFISGGMWSKFRLPTLKPLASLTHLEGLLLISTHVEDGSLAPMTHLSRLRHVGLPNYFATAEFARLAAALSDNIPRLRSPWFREPYATDKTHYAACKTCHAYVRGITIGKPTKHLCPHCHADRMARHVKHWEDLVRAARDRL